MWRIGQTVLFRYAGEGDHVGQAHRVPGGIAAGLAIPRLRSRTTSQTIHDASATDPECDMATPRRRGRREPSHHSHALLLPPAMTAAMARSDAAWLLASGYRFLRGRQ